MIKATYTGVKMARRSSSGCCGRKRYAAQRTEPTRRVTFISRVVTFWVNEPVIVTKAEMIELKERNKALKQDAFVFEETVQDE